jgi:predicted dehydrogenase
MAGRPGNSRRKAFHGCQPDSISQRAITNRVTDAPGSDIVTIPAAQMACQQFKNSRGMIMRKESFIDRRKFIKTAGGGAVIASSLLAGKTRAVPRAKGSISPNDQIGVAFVGLGIRGFYLMDAVRKVPGFRIAACCDLYDGHFERVKELGVSGAFFTKQHEKVLERKDVDAIFVATPDHWHKKIALDALAAGKDVYVEKPMTLRWEDGLDLEAAVKKSGRIFQAGSQQQSNPVNARVKELIRTGALGKITYISGAYHRNTATGAWFYPLPFDASPQTIDWDRFLGATRNVPFDAKRFFRWRLYWDYSGGLATDLFVHLVTATHEVMGARMPQRVVASGGLFNWKSDGREVPDHISGLAEYPEGFILSLTSTANNVHNVPMLTIMGTEGTIEYNPNRCTFYPEPMRDGYDYSTRHFTDKARKLLVDKERLDPTSLRPLASPPAGKPQEIVAEGDATELHVKSFHQCLSERKQPVEDVAFGAQAAAVGHMVNISYRAGKPASWDAARRQVVVG